MESWEPTFHIPGALLFCSLRFGPDIRCVFAALHRSPPPAVSPCSVQVSRRHKDKAIRWPISGVPGGGAGRGEDDDKRQDENPKTPYRTRSGSDCPDCSALIRRSSYPAGSPEEPEHVEESAASVAPRKTIVSLKKQYNSFKINQHREIFKYIVLELRTFVLKNSVGTFWYQCSQY